MDLQELFLDTNTYLTKYNIAFKFQVILGGFLLYGLLNKIFKQSIYSIALTCVIIIILNTILQKYNIGKSDKNKILLDKIKILQNEVYKYIDIKYKDLPFKNPKLKRDLYQKVELDYLYLDANIISFLHENLYLSKYNNQNFFLLVKNTNTFLKFKNSYLIKEQKYKQDILQKCILLKKQILNTCHQFIYSVPKMKELYEELHKSREIFHKLLNGHLEQMGYTNRMDYPEHFDTFDNLGDLY